MLIPAIAQTSKNLAFVFLQRTEVVDDASWVMGFLDIIDPAIDRVKRLLKMDQNPSQESLRRMAAVDDICDDIEASVGPSSNGSDKEGESGFDLDAFISERLFLDLSKLDLFLETTRTYSPKKSRGKFSKILS